MVAVSRSKLTLLAALLALSATLLLWSGAASASPVRFNVFIGSPPPVVVYPYPPVVYTEPPVVEYYEPYPVYYYGYRHAGPPPWAPAHGHWKKHWRHYHGRWHD